jgi:mannose-6-phosphate isomerase-like protein (cupin superfamily)
MKKSWVFLYVFITCFFYSCSDNKRSLNRASQVIVLSESEGEIYSPDRGGRTTMIKISPKTGSQNISLMIQKMPSNTKIITHRHDHTEEVFFVKSGVGKLILEDDTLFVKEGNTVYIPKGVWHGFESDNDSLYLVFAVTPPGLEKFFREIESNDNLSPEQVNDIGKKHDAIAKKE